MADGEQEVALGGAGALELLPHRVEGAGEGRELARPLHRDGLVPPAGGDGGDGARDAPQRARDPAGEQRRDEGREGRPGERRQEQSLQERPRRRGDPVGAQEHERAAVDVPCGEEVLVDLAVGGPVCDQQAARPLREHGRGTVERREREDHALVLAGEDRPELGDA